VCHVLELTCGQCSSDRDACLGMYMYLRQMMVLSFHHRIACVKFYIV